MKYRLICTRSWRREWCEERCGDRWLERSGVESCAAARAAGAVPARGSDCARGGGAIDTDSSCWFTPRSSSPKLLV